MFNYKDNKQNRYNHASFSYNNINKSGKRSPVKTDKVQIFEQSFQQIQKIQPIGKYIVFLQVCH